MRLRLTPLAMSLCFLNIVTMPAFATTKTQNVDQLSQQVSQLQKEVSALQGEVRSTKKQRIRSAHHVKKANEEQRQQSPTFYSNHQAPYSSHQTAKTNQNAAAAYSNTNSNSISGVSTLPTSGSTYIPVDIDVPGQSFVSSGPYIGVPLQFSGSNLIINTPSVNQDVALLKVRKNIIQRLRALGVSEVQDHSHILLSGMIEGQGIYKDIGGGPNSSDIDLTNVTLDSYILGPSEWVSGLMSFTYDNSPGTATGTFANNSRTFNSRVFVKQGFITIGNLTQSPIYGSVGQYYVPFGSYSSIMVSSPLTQMLGRTKARAILVGVSPQKDNTLYGAGYIFQGITHVGATNRVNNGGLNLGYRFSHSKIGGDIGAGVIANIADSEGMQFVSNSSNIFNGFGGPNSTEKISHRVPAYDIRGTLDFGSTWDFIAEYIMASTSFNSNDLTMNNHGAKPQALDTELSYSFQSFSRPTSIGIGYGMSKDALAFQFPAQRYSFVANTSIWRDTLQSLEFRHDKNYAASSVATGSNLPVPTPSGKADNVITAQFDVYF